MKTIVKGKIVENVYSVDPHTKEIKDEFGTVIRTVYEAKPELKKEVDVVEWDDLCSFDHAPIFNEIYVTHWSSPPTNMNIGDEAIKIISKVFVADRDELHLFSSKIVKETDVDRDVSEVNYNCHVRNFNEMMIESNEKMNSYCKLHKLDPRETDAIELFRLIYPDQEYEIKDGKIICKEGTLPVMQSGTIKGTITECVVHPCGSQLWFNNKIDIQSD